MVTYNAGSLHHHAPVVNIQVKENEPEWVTSELRSLAADRDHYYAQAQKSGRAEDWARAKKSRNYVNNLSKQLKKNHIEQSIANCSDHKALWKNIKKLIPSSREEIPSKIKIGQNECSEPKSISNHFNQFFANIGSQLAAKIPNLDLDIPDETELKFKLKNISKTFVEKQLKQLSSGKATGLDNISAKLLKAAPSAISSLLTHIFNLSLETATVPSEWKSARVTPIHKDGPKTDVNNYRPISVIPVVMKILERAVHDQVYTYLTENSLLCHNQSGFRKAHSTSTTLLHVLDDIQVQIDQGKATGVIFLDLKKAFDTVSHKIMVNK